MSQYEQQLIIDSILVRMATLEAKEKDLRTIVTDGFIRMDNEFQWVRDNFARMDAKFVEIDNNFQWVRQRFTQVDEQIDLLALELVTRTDRLEAKMDKGFADVYRKMDKGFAKIDRICEALNIT